MVVWSSLGLNNIAKANLLRSLLCGSKTVPNFQGALTQVRHCSHETLPIRTSKYQYIKFKNLLHFYTLLGLIPIALVVGYTSIFIGPAKLALIPEGYEPKHWEYHRHPITRFMSRYLVPSPQEVYERNLHNIFVSQEKTLLHQLEKKIKNLMKERQDYQAWYYLKPQVKYPRKAVEILEQKHFERSGQSPSGFH